VLVGPSRGTCRVYRPRPHMLWVESAHQRKNKTKKPTHTPPNKKNTKKNKTQEKHTKNTIPVAPHKKKKPEFAFCLSTTWYNRWFLFWTVCGNSHTDSHPYTDISFPASSPQPKRHFISSSRPDWSKTRSQFTVDKRDKTRHHDVGSFNR